jgi:hypothetical protein
LKRTNSDISCATLYPQTSKSAVSRVSKPGYAAPVRRPADWEIGDTAGLEASGTVLPADAKATMKYIRVIREIHG